MVSSWLFLIIPLLIVPLKVEGYAPKHIKPSFVVTHQDLCGIWKLSHPDNNDSKEIVLRLNDDGTFDPYLKPSSFAATAIAAARGDQPLLEQVLCEGGCWDYRDESLLLAANRPTPNHENKDTPIILPVNDTLLTGKLAIHVSETLNEAETLGDAIVDNEMTTAQESDDKDDMDKSNNNIDVHLSIPQGQISKGKFMYPKKHKEFFEEPILFGRSSVGTFAMNQLLGNLNARLQKERDNEAAQNQKPTPTFHPRDFYNRTFYLTATPHPVNPVYAAQDVHYDEDQAVMDVRVMPITFFPNHTFAAIGSEKILRGRFGIIPRHKHDKLWFQVSLFGAGRSSPGSVYSEGRLLTKDDQRGYVGPIQAFAGKHNLTQFFVEGEYYYGEDLKQPRKTRSFGSFTLQEIENDVREGGEEELHEDGMEDDDDTALERFYEDGGQLDNLWDNDDKDAFQ